MLIYNIYRFREEGVKDVVRDVLLPWYHAYRFFVQEATRFESSEHFRPSLDLVHNSENKMDRWIYAVTQSLVKFTQDEMLAYRLYTVIPELVNFLNQLTNWYVRLNRDRMRGQLGKLEALMSLSVLFEVLFTILRLMSPFTPYIAELIYENLKNVFPDGHEYRKDSVHFILMPQPNLGFINKEIETAVATMQAIVILGRTLRERQKVSLKTPLKDVTLVCPSEDVAKSLEDVIPYIKDELNVMECILSTDRSLVELAAVPNFRVLGIRVGKDMPKVTKAVKELSAAELEAFEKTGTITVCGHVLGSDDLTVQRQQPAGKTVPDVLVDCAADIVVMLNFAKDPMLQQMAAAREVANRVQKLRKELNLSQDDPIEMFVRPLGQELEKALVEQEAYVTKCLRRRVKTFENDSIFANLENSKLLHRETFKINDDKLEIVFVCDVNFTK